MRSLHTQLVNVLHFISFIPSCPSLSLSLLLSHTQILRANYLWHCVLISSLGLERPAIPLGLRKKASSERLSRHYHDLMRDAGPLYAALGVMSAYVLATRGPLTGWFKEAFLSSLCCFWLHTLSHVTSHKFKEDEKVVKHAQNKHPIQTLR